MEDRSSVSDSRGAQHHEVEYRQIRQGKAPETQKGSIFRPTLPVKVRTLERCEALLCKLRFARSFGEIKNWVTVLVLGRAAFACRNAQGTKTMNYMSNRKAIGTTARTGETCPESGVWQVTSTPSTTAPIAKGNRMPPYNGAAVTWKLIRYA